MKAKEKRMDRRERTASAPWVQPSTEAETHLQTKCISEASPLLTQRGMKDEEEIRREGSRVGKSCRREGGQRTKQQVTIEHESEWQGVADREGRHNRREKNRESVLEGKEQYGSRREE